MSKTGLDGEETIQSTTEQFQFVPDDVNVMVKESIEEVLREETWHPEKQEQWNNRIMESVLEKLNMIKKPFKYVVQCTTVQRSGCVVHVANACHWDANADGSVTVRWENSFLYVIVSVFGLFV
ncbi:UNVERIFIED_CONTAM: hypothetical protein PYX00_005811 [Menopon gallinae]|uniref:Dynein light chain Tctex-type 1 n=1 Tax=Menopon gallinae TaxID=328185 RepID=A0AAW2HTI6_9NEOP